MATPLSDRDRVYTRLLTAGFIAMRRAIDGRHEDWLRAEWQLLRLVPTLIGESDERRHRWFWEHDRPAYTEWVLTSGPPEAKLDGGTYYDSLWTEMAALMPPKPGGITK